MAESPTAEVAPPSAPRRVIVIDQDAASRAVVAMRLRAQNYLVEDFADAAEGADLALRSPPAAVVADLWMNRISGIQLCRLLRGEPATADVPVILCDASDEPRHRFWADRAGATGFVPKHQIGELLRTLARATAGAPPDAAFVQVGTNGRDIRDRMAEHLDAALFDSVIAAEVRALGTAADFDRLFDLLTQLVSQVARYRWLALVVHGPARFGIHHRPADDAIAEAEARASLPEAVAGAPLRIVDEDPRACAGAGWPSLRPVPFGATTVGALAVSFCSEAEAIASAPLLSLFARELGGPIRIASLVQESQRLAATDALTGLRNRRAFGTMVDREIARSARYGHPLSVALLDLDHFKRINDAHGHDGGDRALAALGELLRRDGLLRATDVAARWGGEEFVVAYVSTGRAGAELAAERLRGAIEALVVTDAAGDRIALTASIGIATHRAGDTLAALVDRADVAMYAAKTAGRNRVAASVEGDAR